MNECQRSLRPDKPGVEGIFATVTSGYRVSAYQPVMVPTKGGGWDEAEMSTFGPVVMAGISPRLDDDVVSRLIRVLLMPMRRSRHRLGRHRGRRRETEVRGSKLRRINPRFGGSRHDLQTNVGVR